MKTGLQTVVAVYATLFLPVNAFSLAAETKAPTAMKPLGAASFDVGSKHVVGYFLASDGRCKLTLMIGEAGGAAQSSAARLLLVVDPGRSARFDSESGQSLRFACKSEALAMSATPVETHAAQDADE